MLDGGTELEANDLGPRLTITALLAGMAARHQPHVALPLLAALLGLQGVFTLLALALRPYISVVLNIIEVASGCLEIVYLALTMAAYMYTQGALPSRGERGQDAYLAVSNQNLVQTCMWCLHESYES